MRIFLAGATGAIGTRLVPLLAAAGHTVLGTTRHPDKADRLRFLGAEPVVLDPLDAAAVAAAVAAARPDVIVHQLTALSGIGSFRKFSHGFEMTNRLRTEGTDNLLAAGRAAGVGRVVAQSFGGWPYARTGGPVKTETDPLDPDPVPGAVSSLAAIKHLEAAVTGYGEGLALRYGGFYGPGTSLSPGGPHTELVRRRKFPIVGDGGGIWSFCHIDDAASATVAAVSRGAAGVYNVCDDEPAAVRDFLPVLCAELGAKPPRHVPAWLARPLVGD
ncbi:MAG TPA: NAD(P)-dependent oxidoreductase, partial [Mycobacteriales bacterium]|nr:NAD(P)-dependent oxidoreductase [Mycobacteriales bacterium]